jgi:hypothetical protein
MFCVLQVVDVIARATTLTQLPCRKMASCQRCVVTVCCSCVPQVVDVVELDMPPSGCGGHAIDAASLQCVVTAALSLCAAGGGCDRAGHATLRLLGTWRSRNAEGHLHTKGNHMRHTVDLITVYMVQSYSLPRNEQNNKIFEEWQDHSSCWCRL